MVTKRNLPTRDGRTEGIDPTSGLKWAVEPAEIHWAEHDARLVTYWRSRPAAERLEQAGAYRVRIHGLVAAPSMWTWRLVPFGHVEAGAEGSHAKVRPVGHGLTVWMPRRWCQ